MTTPPEPRPSTGRSSFAIAMKDYTFIRPSIAVSIGAATLLAALVIGVVLIQSLGRAAEMVRRGGQTAATLHSYNAALEVWSVMAARGDPRLERPEAKELRDSIRAALTVRFRELRAELTHPMDRDLVETVIQSLREREVGLTAEAREAMIVLLARQDEALFGAAEDAQEAVLYVSFLLALTAVAAGLMIVPMAWLYIRHKRSGA
ncbi:MAG: hypothetical protein ACREMJ_08110 [Gemmatimonadales bacterium]